MTAVNNSKWTGSGHGGVLSKNGAKFKCETRTIWTCPSTYEARKSSYFGKNTRYPLQDATGKEATICLSIVLSLQDTAISCRDCSTALELTGGHKQLLDVFTLEVHHRSIIHLGTST